MPLIPTLHGPGGPARRIAAVVATAAILLAGVGICTWIYTLTTSSTENGETHNNHNGHDDGGGVDTGDPAQVAASVLTTMYSWNPAADHSPTDAARRALPQLVGNARADIERPSTPVRPIAQWPQWATDKTLITAAIDTTDITTIPDATPTGTQLRVPVLQLIQPTTGPSLRYTKFAVRVHLTNTDHRWSVDHMTITDFS